MTIYTAGTFNVIVTDANGCTGVASIDVTVNSNPTPIIVTNLSNNVCDASSLVMDAGSGYASYFWNMDGVTDQVYMPGNGSYNYIVEVTDNNGCIGTASFEITVQNDPIYPVITANLNNIVCDASSLVMDGGAGYASYLWYNWGGTEQTLIPNYNQSFTYYLRVTDNNGCTGTGSFDITVVNNPLTPVITPSGTTVLCEGNSVDLYIGSYSSYSWITGETTESITASVGGTYSVTVTDANGCTGVASIDVTVNPSPTPVITSNGPTDFSLCDGSHVDFTLDAGAGYASYNWYTWYHLSTQTITPNQDYSGTYSVEVTDVNGCIGTASLNVNIVNLPPVNEMITPSGPTTFNQGDHVILDAGSYSYYSWSNGSTDESIDVNTGGTYSVTVTDANGCIGTASQIVIVNTMICSITPSGPTTFCEGGSVLLDAGSGAAYLWSDGSTNQQTIAAVSGDFCVTITDVNNQTCEACINVTVYPNPIPSISGTSIICDGSSTIIDAGVWDSYIWNTGAITESISISTTDTYTVEVIDGNGCTGSASLILSVNPNPTPTIFGGSVACEGNTVFLTANQYDSYNWSTGDTDGFIFATATSNYCLTVTDANGCTGVDCHQVTINSNPVPVITSNGPTSFCDGGSVNLDAGTYSSYIWNTSENTETITVNATASYIVLVYDSNGCSGSATQDVTVNPNPTPSITANGNTTFCDGGSVDLDAGAYASYAWSTGETTETIVANTTGIYSVIVTDGNDCLGMAAEDITVYSSPTVGSTISPSSTICSGTSITLTGTGGDSYSWTGGISDGFAFTPSISTPPGLSTSNASLMIGLRKLAENYNGFSIQLRRDSDNGIMDFGFDGLDLDVNAISTWLNGANGYCTIIYDQSGHGNNVTQVNYFNQPIYNQTGLNGKPALHFNPSQFMENLTNYPSPFTVVYGARQTGPTRSRVLASAYTNWLLGWWGGLKSCAYYEGWVNYGYGADSNPTIYSGASNGSISEVYENGTLITSNSNGLAGPNGINLNGSGVYGERSDCDFMDVIIYNTVLSNQDRSVVETHIANYYSVPNTSNTISYTVTGTGVNGCTATSMQYIINNQSPTPVLTSNGPTTFCDGGSVTLDAGSWSSYIWSSGETNETISTTSAGTYSVTVSDANGCAGSISQDVIVNSNPTPSMYSYLSPIFCEGNFDMLYPDQNIVYNSALWSNGSTDSNITVYTSGDYGVTVTDANGCTGITSITVTENLNPTTSIIPNGNTTFCSGGSVSFDAGSWSAYSWSTTEVTQTITVTTSGNYSVIITDANGCSGSASINVNVNNNPTPSIVPNGPTSFCQGGSVTLNAGNYAVYNWSNGETTSSIVATTTGTFSVTVADANGCIGAAAIQVNVNPNIIGTITPSGPTTFCTGSSVTLDPGVYTSYHWSNNATTQTINVSATGIYRVTLTNANGCTGIASQAVTVNTSVGAVSVTGPASTCSGGNVTLTTGSYLFYNWSNGATTQSINVAATGIYYVTVSNENACTGVAHASVSVLVSPVPNVLVTGLNNLCGGGFATLAVGGTYAAFNWSTAETTQSIAVSTSNTYTVTVTSSNGCTGTNATIITGGCTAPTNLATTNIAPTTAYISWTQPSCYVTYTIQISKHNVNVWTTYTINPNNHYTFSGLSRNTAYDWQIRTNCNLAQTSTSPWSGIQQFTTLARLEGETDVPISDFNVYPNPASDHVNIVFAISNVETYSIRLMDVIGNIVINQNSTSVVGDNQYQLNITNISHGVYLLVIQKGESTMQKRIVVE